MECTLLPTKGNYYYYIILLLYVENVLLFSGTLAIIMGILHSFEAESYLSNIRFKNIMSSLLLTQHL